MAPLGKKKEPPKDAIQQNGRVVENLWSCYLSDGWFQDTALKKLTIIKSFENNILGCEYLWWKAVLLIILSSSNNYYLFTEDL